jgi:hypothetical protein
MAKPKQSSTRLPQASPARGPQAPRPPRVTAPRVTAPRVAPPAAAAPPPGPPPGTVSLAVKLMYAGAALAAIDLIVTLATAGNTKALLHQARPSLSPADLTASAHAFIAGSIITWLITIALWIVMARTNLAGRGWARVVSTVLCVASTLSFVGYISQPSSLFSKLILVPMWLVGVGAIVSLWRPETTAYIQAETAYLQTRRA